MMRVHGVGDDLVEGRLGQLAGGGLVQDLEDLVARSTPSS